MYEATLLTSAYNSAPFIRHKVLNFLSTRDHADVEMVIVDCTNGADSKLVEDLIPGNPIRVIVLPKRVSVWVSVNRAILESNSPYVVQANTDDLVHPEAYRKQIDKLNEGSDISYFNYGIHYKYEADYSEALRTSYDTYLTPPEGYSTGRGLGPFPMWRKSLHDTFGLFDEGLEILADSVFWDKLQYSKIKWGHIPEILGVYASRAGQNLECNQELMSRDIKKLRGHGRVN